MNATADNVWIVVAAYNEGKVLADVLQPLLLEWPNVVVVDDGSKDATGDVALEAGAVVVRHPINLGQGAALKTGIDYALKRGAEYIVTFDADGQHRVSDIPALLKGLRDAGADIATGSRFLGHAEGMRRSKRIVLKAAVLFTRMTTGMKVTDAHNGFRCLTRKAAKVISINQNRMAHASEIISEIARNKLVAVEVPVTIDYTEYSMAKGQSIFNSFNILVDLFLARLQK